MISVCMATYNGSQYIKEQLHSILTQLGPEDEVIISDDSSTDNTLDIVLSFSDPRIKIFPGNRFYSPVYNFENAIKNASGKYIFLSDQDDVWLPEKIKMMKKKLDSYTLVVSDCYVTDNKLNIIYPSFFELRKSKKGFFSNLIKNSFLGCCMAFNREALVYLLPFPKKISMHDIWIGLNISLYGKVRFLSEKTIYFRRHSGNASETAKRSSNSNFKKLEIRFIMLKNILKRFLHYRFKSF